MSTEDNTSQKADEVEALAAIYSDDFTVVDEVMNTYSVRVVEGEHVVVLEVIMPPDYPSSSPPRFDIDTHWLRGVRRRQLEAHLQDTYLEHIGECIVYQWVERVRTFLQELSEVEETAKDVADMVLSEAPIAAEAPSVSEEACPEITSGELILDRKSVFQPHLARVTSTDQVRLVLSRLRENRKIASATHNIFAYRVSLAGGVMAQDCEDDGETKAGSRMLHLLGVLDVIDVLVVVTRWYGGVHLGPDRFKHINTATRQILDKCNLIPDKKAKKSK